MDFVKLDNSIRCIRLRRRSGTRIGTCVAEFDARQREIPPHVEGSLTSSEVEELKAWLRERNMIKRELSQSGFGTALALAIPKLIDAALDNLGEEADAHSLAALQESSDKLSDYLSETPLDVHNAYDETQIEHMDDSEMLKVYLDNIRRRV